MSTLAIALAEIALLKARVEALEAGGGGASSSSSDGIRRELPIDDHQLEKDWADKKIAKDPKKWKGATQVNKTWSRAPIDWLELAAESMEYKAHCGRLEPNPRLSNKVRNGKPVPWHESDSFDAKILRGWIERKRKAPPKDVAKAAPPAGADDDFGFGHNTPATGTDDDIGF